MKTLYLCGGINGLSDEQCKTWRERVKAELDGLYEFRDPMRRDYRGIEDQSVNEIVTGDYDDIRASDIVLVAADTPSWGTAMEMHHAFINEKKRVIAVCGVARVSPWLRYHSHTLVQTLGEAIQMLRAGA